MTFPATDPVLTATSQVSGVRLTWTPPVPDPELVLFRYMVAYTRVTPAPAWPPSGGPYGPDGGWYIVHPFGDPGSPVPPTTTVDVPLATHEGVLHHFILGCELSPAVTPTSGGYHVYSNVANGTPVTVIVLPTVDRVTHWETHRGRNFEFDKIEAGTATITLLNRDGIFDPLKTDGVYVGTGNLLPLRQVRITANTPAHPTVYHDIFTGYVEAWNYERRGPRHALATLELTDGFELLQNSEVIVTKNNKIGGHYFDVQPVDERIKAALQFAGWPAARTSIFTGNVHVMAVNYEAGSSMLQVIQEAADAELPALANFYMDKSGVACFRGRKFRLDPFNTEWNTARSRAAKLFKFADDGALNEFDGVAPTGGDLLPMANLEWSLNKEHIYTVVSCSPMNVDPKLKYSQTVSDSGQAKKFGKRDLTIDGLIVWTGAGPPTQTGAQQCKRYALWYLQNYKKAFVRATNLEVHSKFDDDAIWTFLTEVEIGDLVELYTRNPGGGGFNGQQFYVDGIHNVVDAIGEWPQWVSTYDLTPVGHWKQDDWPGYFPPPYPAAP